MTPGYLQQLVPGDVMHCAGDLDPVADAGLHHRLGVMSEGQVQGLLQLLPAGHLTHTWTLES